MEKNYTEEELEYRRYLRRCYMRRKRRRQILIARTIACLICVLFVIGIFTLIRFAVKGGSRGADSEKKAVKVEITKQPYVTHAPVDVPEEYREVYNQLIMLQEEYPELAEITVNIKKYPEELLNLVVSNQETIPFVLGYLLHKNDVAAGGTLTAGEIEEGIPLLLQWDERWGYLSYGGKSLAISGCGPTCMAMVYAGLKQSTEMSPADMAAFSLENNYYNAESGTSWLFMSDGAQTLGLNAAQIPISETSIQSELEQGHPVICSMVPGDFTSGGHFIVIRGVTKKGKLLINDPNSKKRSQKKWNFDRVLPQIKAAWSYSV